MTADNITETDAANETLEAMLVNMVDEWNQDLSKAIDLIRDPIEELASVLYERGGPGDCEHVAAAVVALRRLGDVSRDMVAFRQHRLPFRGLDGQVGDSGR